MNAQRLLLTLQNVKLQLQRKQYCSAEQLRVLRKTRARLNKQLKQFTNPSASARPLPQPLSSNKQLKLL